MSHECHLSGVYSGAISHYEKTQQGPCSCFGDFLLLIQGNVESKWPMSQDLNSSGQFQNAEIIDLKNKKVTV